MPLAAHIVSRSGRCRAAPGRQNAPLLDATVQSATDGDSLAGLDVKKLLGLATPPRDRAPWWRER